MAITASGLFYLTLEKMFIDTAAQSIEAETHKSALVTNASTPNFDTHDFLADLTEVSAGGGYTALGNTLTTTELTTSSGVATYDAADSSWPTSTITARANVGTFNIGSAATDMLIWLSNFGADASSVGGTFSVVYAGTGIWTWDFTP